MRIHRLKVDPAPLADLITRKKTAEVRRFDRDFQVGDDVYVYEYSRRIDDADPAAFFTGSWAQLKISHILPPGQYGLPADVGVMSVILVGYGRLPPKTAEQIYNAGQPIA